MKKRFICLLVGVIICLITASAVAVTYETGDSVYFGHYEQDGKKENGKESIEWIVLDKSGDKLLLLSKYCLDALPYHDDENVTGEISWQECSLNKWLNNDFFTTAFSESEQIAITPSEEIITDFESYFKNGAIYTDNPVFLLDTSEKTKYFPEEGDFYAMPTITLYNSGKITGKWGDDGGYYVIWWLRGKALAFNEPVWGYSVNNQAVRAIRPAVWLDTTLYTPSLEREANQVATTPTPKPIATTTPDLTATPSPKPTVTPEPIATRAKTEAKFFSYEALSDGTAIITKYTGTDAKVVIPEYLDGFKVTGIGEGVFQLKSDITSVEIPDTVTTIEDEAFSNCFDLTEVELSSSLTTIGKGAFSGCSELKEIIFPEGLISIGDSAFENCYCLANISFPDSLVSIGDHSFKGCMALTSLVLPKNLAEVGTYAFEMCFAYLMESSEPTPIDIVIPEKITTLPEGVFQDCWYIGTVTLPEGLKNIGEKAFYDCWYMSNIALPNGLETIGAYAFDGCSYLEDITIPDSIKSIKRYAFSGCDSLKISVPESAADGIDDDAFDGCRAVIWR